MKSTEKNTAAKTKKKKKTSREETLPTDMFLILASSFFFFKVFPQSQCTVQLLFPFLFLLQTFRHFYLKSNQHLADLRGAGSSTCRQLLRLPAQFDRGAVVEALAGPPQLAVRRS